MSSVSLHAFYAFFNPKSEVTELTSEQNSSQSVAHQPPEPVGHFTSVFEHMKAGSKTWRKLSSLARNRVPGKENRKVGPPADWGAIITDNPHVWGPGLWKVSEAQEGSRATIRQDWRRFFTHQQSKLRVAMVFTSHMKHSRKADQLRPGILNCN